MNRIINLMVLFIALLGSTSGDLEYTTCDESEVISITSDVCSESPCKITKEKPFTINIEFIPKNDAKDVKFALSTPFFGAEFDLPVDNPDACESGFIQCPVTAGKKTTFKYNGKLDSDVPAMGATVVFRLKNENEDVLVCAKTEVDIEDGHDEL